MIAFLTRWIGRLLIPTLSTGAMGFAVLHVIGTQKGVPAQELVIEPPRSPFGQTVAGAGLVEASSESSMTANTLVGSLVPGTVVKVHVQVGQHVQAGAPLFDLDDRQMKADLGVKRANLQAARAQLKRLEMMPRPEEIPPAEARVREAHASLAQMEDHAERARRLFATRAIGQEELISRLQAASAAKEVLAAAQANLALLKAGAWEADKLVARASVAQAEAQVAQTEVELERLRVRAPIEGQVLAVNVRLGEFVGAAAGQTLIVLGKTDRLCVRVDIDETDIPRFRPGAAAKARLRGDPRQEFTLTFVRVEPYVVPKRSLTGDNVERVDTRVLQVIYAIDAGSTSHCPLYVGMQLDVFVETNR